MAKLNTVGAFFVLVLTLNGLLSQTVRLTAIGEAGFLSERNKLAGQAVETQRCQHKTPNLGPPTSPRASRDVIRMSLVETKRTSYALLIKQFCSLRNELIIHIVMLFSDGCDIYKIRC